MNEAIDGNDKLEEMFSYLSTHEKIVFKSERSENKVLTAAEKHTISKDMFTRSPPLFLECFYKYLDIKIHGSCFDNYQSDEIVQFYLRKIKNATSSVLKKNRRYKKLANLLAEGKYFSKEQMKFRQPLLFERYLGRQEEEEEKENDEEETNRSLDTFSGFLMTNMLNREDRIRRTADALKEQKLLAICSGNNGTVDDSDDDEDEEDEGDQPNLEQEFLTIMKEKFLSGEDDFNYSDVDNDSTLDDLEELSRDLEDKYFDEEEPSEIDNTVQIIPSSSPVASDDGFIEYGNREKLNQYLSH